MNYYEGMYIIDPTMPDEKIKELTDSITAELSQKGEVLAIEKLGKRPLAYSVKKMTEGYYMVVYFSSEPGEITQLHRKYGLNPSIIRVMILKRDKEEILKIKEKLGVKAESKEDSAVPVITERSDWDAPEEDWKEEENLIQLPDENLEESGELDKNTDEI